MGDITKIEWTDATWNPVTGCTKVSQGCKHCYAERDWARLVHLPADMSDLVLPIGISYNTLRTYFERARVKADMPAIHWHDLRHTAASWWAQSGATLVLLRDLLGHTSFAETSRYSHLVRGDLKAGAERMAERMTVDLSVAQDSHKDT